MIGERTNDAQHQFVPSFVDLEGISAHSSTDSNGTYATNKRVVHDVDVGQKLAVIVERATEDTLGVFSQVEWISVGGCKSRTLGWPLK